MSKPSVAIVGAGRMGQGLALALGRAGYAVALTSRSSHPVIRPLRLHAGPRGEALRAADVILLAVPDRAIEPLAADLAAEGSVTRAHTVLHLSGLRDRTALVALDSTDAALGSLHPLQT
ncbi:MAG: NAD(P)-binding domain-containing protein, partial [Gemmatimonadales bacterium]